MHGDETVIVLAPFGRDAFVIEQTLSGSDVRCLRAQTMTEATDHLRAGAGTMLLTQESLSPPAVNVLLAALADQPPWSDVPVLLLLGVDITVPSAGASQVATITASRNITVLQRPLPALTLITAVQAALRARRRQYEVRSLIERDRAAREQAEAAVQVKDEFLATVSHELRTPLSAIMLWANLFDAGRLSPAQQLTAMQAIKTSAATQSQLVEDLLDVSRSLMGTLRIHPTPAALGPVIDAAVELVRPMADAKGVHLDIVLEARDEQILVDVARAQQIFWNLLTNALKFTPSGGTVSVRLAREDHMLVAIIADTGQGIGPALLPHVFERFRQGDPNAGPRGGLGLGLPIVKQLVELHGGTVDVESAGHGHGATFTLRLPARPSASPAAP